MMNIPMVKSAASTVMVMLISSSFVVTAGKNPNIQGIVKIKSIVHSARKYKFTYLQAINHMANSNKTLH